MINLDGVQPFAEGGNRRCYVHPENSYRCLKVTIQDKSKIAKEKAPWYKKFRSESTFDDNIREQKAYAQRALKKDNPEKWKHLARWHGMVETSIGLASETDLIRDNQNNIAITLEKYLFTYGMTDEIQKAIKEFEPTVLLKSLDSAIFYYEEREEYEKCAHLLKIKKLMKKS